MQASPFCHTGLLDCPGQNRSYQSSQHIEEISARFTEDAREGGDKREAEFAALEKENEDVQMKCQVRQGQLGTQKKLFARGPQKRQHKPSPELWSYLGDWPGICSLFVCRGKLRIVFVRNKVFWAAHLSPGFRCCFRVSQVALPVTQTVMEKC